MTTKLPFTQIGIVRAIAGVRKAGMHVVGVKGDGTLIVADKPFDIASLVPVIEQNDSASKWEDQPGT
jgi:hypothetical protein